MGIRARHFINPNRLFYLHWLSIITFVGLELCVSWDKYDNVSAIIHKLGGKFQQFVWDRRYVLDDMSCFLLFWNYTLSQSIAMSIISDYIERNLYKGRKKSYLDINQVLLTWMRVFLIWIARGSTRLPGPICSLNCLYQCQWPIHSLLLLLPKM